MNESGPNLDSSQSESEPSVYDYMLAFEAAKLRSMSPEMGVLMARNKSTFCKGKSLTAPFLQKGDVLVVQAETRAGADRGYVYKVHANNWYDLGISNYAPKCQTIGVLDGMFVPDDVKGEEVALIGSGAGSSMVISQTVAPNACIYVSNKKGKEHHMPITNDFAVARKDENGELKIMNSSDLARSNERIEEKHGGYLQSIAVLMAKFGFDNRDFEDCRDADTHSYLCEKDNLVVTYRAGMATGNELIILNKENNQVTVCKYFNYSNEDLLQIAYADLTDAMEVDRRDDGVIDVTISGIYRARVPVVTFNSSAKLGVEEVTYHVGTREASEDLEIPSFYVHGPSEPNIQLWPNGTTEISFNVYPLSAQVAEDPSLEDKIRQKISATWDEEGGNHTFNIGGKMVKTRSVEEVLRRF